MEKALFSALLLSGFAAATASAQTVLWSEDFSGGLSAGWTNTGFQFGGCSYSVVGGQLEVRGNGQWSGASLTRTDRTLAVGETVKVEFTSLANGPNPSHNSPMLIVANQANLPGDGTGR